MARTTLCRAGVIGAGEAGLAMVVFIQPLYKYNYLPVKAGSKLAYERGRPASRPVDIADRCRPA